MKAFKNHQSIIEDYKKFLKSFFTISDRRIKEEVEKKFEENSSCDSYIPEPLIQFNPSYKTGLSLDDIPGAHSELKNILGKFSLYHHQVEAIKKGIENKGFIVTSGTGSGKSLTFLATIFNDVLKSPGKGIRAIIVYPMNALINSQEEEIKKYEINYLKSLLRPNIPLQQQNEGLDEQITELKSLTKGTFPVTYAKYTGQENATTKEIIREEEPHIILTNYMMLELIMTRYEERVFRESMSKYLKFLAFDELHTYRGRQGADVAMLIRRIKNLCNNKLVCIGTSATMSSEGNADERKKAVGAVADLIFDESYSLNQIIGEQLETSTDYAEQIPSSSQLSRSVHESIDSNDGADKFKSHPLAIWLERKIALDDTNGYFERGKPQPLSAIIQQLSKDSGENSDDCKNAMDGLLGWIEQLNIKAADENPRKSYLPFKIHQFISQTGTVQVTLDSRDARYITLNDELYTKINGAETLLYPVLFSRYSGVDFLCVKLINDKIMPRDPDNMDDLPPKITQEDIKADKVTGRQKRILNIEDFPYGYLILQDDDEDEVWNEDDKDYLPDSWFTETLKYGRRIKNFYEYRLPQLLHFDKNGNYSWKNDNKLPLKAWYIPAYLLFDPTSGIIFDLKTNENTKLSRLGNEGRSSATTILGANILKSLSENNIPLRNQKFLSFTDNRQDASLQAGHFNDFFTIARLRSAIHKSVRNNLDGLDSNRIGIEVFKELNLREDEYAKYLSKNPNWPDEGNINAIQKYIIIRILYDLKLGWRYTTPNLEQTALVQIGYKKLNDFCKIDSFFSHLSWLKNMSSEEREYTFTQILNYFRTSFAFDHIYLVQKREEIETELKNLLDEKKPWSLDFEEKIDVPYVLLPYSKGKAKTREYTASIGPASYLGKYIKRLVKDRTGQILKQDDLSKEIDTICQILVEGHYLNQIPVKTSEGTMHGYRIRVDHILWKPGDEVHTLRDEVRFMKYKNIESTPNLYFQDFYKQDFKTYERQGKEHTGQLGNAKRIEREDDFREGKLSALFCSPTMELGIDISQLNIVHMRNVPPRPDNYSQRSGRAGRSGQSALVFTFCSQKSPHDRNYFKDPTKMVHGSVIPPRMDITNMELIRSHLDAFIMMELGIDIKVSISEIIDINKPELPVYEHIRLKIEEIQKHQFLQWAKQFDNILRNINKIDDTSWYSDKNWLIDQVQFFYKRFDNAFKRWRILYTNTKKTLEEAHSVISTPNSPKIGDAKRMQAIALRQRDLLLNKSNSSSGNESEFYVFRYLASEGFLPGYNFTRLPVRTFVGNKSAEQGEYVSRPRFIALKEFGPNNLIYHDGSKYKVVKMQLNQNGEQMHTIKISKETGYVFVGKEAENTSNDPITRKELKDFDSFEKFSNVVELNESEARIEERISCNEEYRTSQGYDIDHYFSFSKGIDNTQKAIIKAAEHDLLQVIYDQSATLLQINNKWKITKDDSFPIGTISGRWKSRIEAEQSNPDEPIAGVRIYTTTTSDILYIQPVKELQLKEEGVCTLAYALKRAIEKVCQVEESEIGVWIMGKNESKNILLYESSEGSLGILKDLLNNAAQLQAIFKEAYNLLGFDPETLIDTRPDTPKASYDDLLSYYNQQYHEKLDRFSVKEALEKLMRCNIDNQQGGRTLEEQYNYLLRTYDLNSSTEKPLIEYLYRNGLKLPDKAQMNIQNLYVNADFVYKISDNQFALIFCDGSVHDQYEIKKEDQMKRQNCRDAGYEVVEWHYTEPIEEFVKRNKHIFKVVR